ncbi:IS66 family insertion sequence element accessory protein TnpB [Sorangium sp. So ce260]|uniref:IS66 family insertion sequence element accessory protein TnpB n=1 Tax=Sorangium sp. So ce260 TaxID=3133291 RepID=UPI003F5EB647
MVLDGGAALPAGAVVADASPVVAEPLEIALSKGRGVRVRPGFDLATLERRVGDVVLTLPPSMRVCVAAEPADLRKRFDGLSSFVAQRFDADPRCGHLFVCRKRRGNQIRVLFWDRTG